MFKQNRLCHDTLLSGGSRGPNWPRSPPFFLGGGGLVFCFLFAFHPGGRSGRRTVAKNKSGKNVSGSPTPPPAERLFQAWRGIAAFGFPAFPFSQILDPPLLPHTSPLLFSLIISDITGWENYTGAVSQNINFELNVCLLFFISETIINQIQMKEHIK